MNKRETVLTKKDLRKMNKRYMPMAVNTYNYAFQQAGTVIFALAPLLRKIYKDDNEYVKALNNHYQYFNTHPWFCPLVLGATLAIEDNDGIDSLQAVQDFKTGLMGPLAGIGDTIIWVLYPTIMGSIAGYMAIEGNILGAAIWIVINVALWFVRVRFAELGYKSGTSIIKKLGERLSDLTESLSLLGLIIAGALIPSVVKVTTPITFQVGEVSTSIQTILDQILPYALPLLVTTLCYKLIKSDKISVSKLILIIVVFSMVCAGFGILS